MFDGIFDLFAEVLNFFYTLIPNYAVAIALLTLLVMVLTTPFTLKGTRSMIQMQRLQPEMRKLQLKYKDDRQKLNEELMAFYKENNLNPLGGCLPLLLQTPIFIILYNVIRGLTRIEDGTFDPKYLKHSSDLYQSLTHTDEMLAFDWLPGGGVDLAISASKSLQEGFWTGFPHVVMVVIVALTSYYQQKQIQGRNPNVEMPPQQKMMMRLFPAMFVVIAFVSPSALVVYFMTSNLYRIAMQAYITRTLYHGEDSLGAQAAKATAEARKLKEEQGGPGLIPKVGRRGADPKPADKPAEKPAPAAGESSGGSNGSEATPRSTPPPTSRTTPASSNRSKKKKKRR
jgi:YidC/Oxa1 family membrane protein insertase